MSKRAIGITATIISAVYFGFLPFFVNIISTGGGNGISASFYRFFFSLPFIFIYLKIRKIPMKISLKELGQIAMVAILGYGGTGVLLFSSYHFIPSGMATTLHFMYPVFTILGCIVFLKKKVQPAKIFCVILCTIGIFMFYQADGGANILGILLAGGSGVTYAFYTIYLDNSDLKKMETLKLIFYLNIVSSAVIFLVAQGIGEFTYDLSTAAWTVAVLFAFATSFIGVFGYQVGVKNIGAESTTILSTFEPITSLIIGIVAYSEKLNMTSAMGALCIISAAVIVAKIKE